MAPKRPATGSKQALISKNPYLPKPYKVLDFYRETPDTFTITIDMQVKHFTKVGMEKTKIQSVEPVKFFTGPGLEGDGLFIIGCPDSRGFGRKRHN